VETVVRDPAAEPSLLFYLLDDRRDIPSALRRELLSHRAMDPEALDRAAAREKESELLEVLVLNHELLRARPALVQTLRSNPALGADLRRRLEDVAEHLPVSAPEAEDGAALSPQGLPLATDPRLAAAGIDAEVEAMLPLLDIDVGELLSTSEIRGGAEFAEDDEYAPIYARIVEMTVGEKLRMALFGTREERAILVRDTNRIVATAVVKNPRLSEQEFEIISNSRDVSDDVLLELMRRREAMRRYVVVHNLVRNPKVPIPSAIGLITRLHDRDLKLLTVNRNISEAVRAQARKQFQTRQDRQQAASFRKRS
jgi:hypothetical protein